MTNTTGLSILVAFIIELFVVTKAYHAYVPHLPIIYNEGSGTYRTVFAFSYVHCKGNILSIYVQPFALQCPPIRSRNETGANWHESRTSID